jgi:alkanesulfonate monooxygenase SsuD/methylene tetrahydromethanopterin reductase-like flavin-dependent oxidoreductase (luciferase family)
VPIVLASRAPGVLSLAGEVADAAMLEGLFTPTALEWALGKVADGAAKASRTLDGVETISWQALFLGDDPHLAEQPSMRRWAALLIHTTRPEVLRQIGVSEAAVRAVAADVASRGGVGEPSGDGVTGDDVSKLLLVGTPAQVRDRVEELRERGVSSVACVLFGDADEIATTMRRFAVDVVQA